MDHGLLSAVKQRLQRLPELSLFGIYTFAPAQRLYPFCLIELESIQSSCSDIPPLEKTRIAFTISLILKEGSKQLTLGRLVRQTFDGTEQRLKEDHHVLIRLMKGESHSQDKLFTLRQHFEALITY